MFKDVNERTDDGRQGIIITHPKSLAEAKNALGLITGQRIAVQIKSLIFFIYFMFN